MALLAKLVIALVALIHTYIAWFEIFAWTTRGPKVFKSPALLSAVYVLNGEVAAGANQSIGTGELLIACEEPVQLSLSSATRALVIQLTTVSCP